MNAAKSKYADLEALYENLAVLYDRLRRTCLDSGVCDVNELPFFSETFPAIPLKPFQQIESHPSVSTSPPMKPAKSNSSLSLRSPVLRETTMLDQSGSRRISRSLSRGPGFS